MARWYLKVVFISLSSFLTPFFVVVVLLEGSKHQCIPAVTESYLFSKNDITKTYVPSQYYRGAIPEN